jgi:hypothetical protein
MRLPRLVVLCRTPLKPMGQRACVKIGGSLPGCDLFDEVQQRTPIPVSHR